MKGFIAQQADVLIVDDEIEILELIAESLEGFVANAYLAGSVSEAEKHLQSKKLDALVCDLGLKGGSGMELIKSVKTRFPWLPIIVITGQGNEKLEEELLIDLGCFDYIKKPFSMLSLQNRLQNAILYSQMAEILWAITSANLDADAIDKFLRAAKKDQAAYLAAQVSLLKLKNVFKKVSSE